MKQELSKNLVCISMRTGVEIWIEQDRLDSLTSVLTSANPPRFVQIDQQFVNLADVVGVFSAMTMQDATRRKNGQWQCQQSNWHERKDNCQCAYEKELAAWKKLNP